MDPATAQVLAAAITALATVAVAWLGIYGRRDDDDTGEED